LERRLAAILAADVAGYTALMGDDETGTLRRLTDLRREVLEPLIDEHRGRVVKLMGDGLLVEFASVVDAVACALAWQGGVNESEATTAENKRLQFRIGINLGDVIVQGDDIHGDGVNIAARLENLARPGDICLSGDTYRQVRGKIDVEFDNLGEQEVKNVKEPVQVYRISAPVSIAGSFSQKTEPLALPDKPSIAVLPFTNMTGDPEQEYFSDGVTAEITTQLARFRDLFVISQNSAFLYKNSAASSQKAGQDLGVAYILEGSIQKAGNRVRIAAKLLDAATSVQLWAERYDRELSDIFAVQGKNCFGPGRTNRGDRPQAGRAEKHRELGCV
jgi:adenylate cyclase